MSREVIVGIIEGENIRTKNQTSFKGRRDVRIPDVFLTDLAEKDLVLLLVTEEAMVDIRMVFERSEHMLVLKTIDGYSITDQDWVAVVNGTNWLDYAMTALPDVTRLAWDSNAMKLQPDLQGYQTIGGIPNVTVVGHADDYCRH